MTDVLQRDYYVPAAAASGYRSGQRAGRLNTAEGEVSYTVPQVRGLPGWRSQVREALGGRSEKLERLATEMDARGLSMRDIEAVFTDEAGRSLLSRSAASQVAARLWEDYQAFAARSLAELEIVDLFVDGIAERLHLGQPCE